MCEQDTGLFKTLPNAGNPVGETSVCDAEYGRGVAVVRAVGHSIETRRVILRCNGAARKNERSPESGRKSPFDEENFNVMMIGVIPNEE